MKKKEKLTFLLIISALLYPLFSYGQCDTDTFLDKCASNLGTYNYIKSFVVSANPRKKSYSEFSYVFSKGSTYIMLACTEKSDDSNMIISLYDRHHDLIACNFNEETKKCYPDLQYSCSATGVYYIKTTFEGTKRGCGMCILGFNKN